MVSVLVFCLFVWSWFFFQHSQCFRLPQFCAECQMHISKFGMCDGKHITFADINTSHHIILYGYMHDKWTKPLTNTACITGFRPTNIFSHSLFFLRWHIVSSISCIMPVNGNSSSPIECVCVCVWKRVTARNESVTDAYTNCALCAPVDFFLVGGGGALHVIKPLNIH